MGADWMGLIWLVVLLLGNSFFVAAEFAVVAAKRSQIEPRAQEGSAAAKTALYAMEHVSLMLAICQLGITVCSLLLGNVAEPAIHHLLSGPLEGLGIPAGLSSTISFILALGVVTYLHVVIGEMVPKNMALASSGTAVMLLARPLVFLAKVFGFVIRPLNSLANSILRLFKIEPRDEVNEAFTIEQVESIVAESKREGLLTDDTGLLKGALEFSDKTAADIMVPMLEIVTISGRVSPDELVTLVGKTGFSRYFVIDAEGYPENYLHIKDVLYADSDLEYDSPVPGKRFRPLFTVKFDDEVEEALAQMQKAGIHVARVVAANGQVLGLLFLEDVLEELVGEVQDAMQRGRFAH
ncbi:hemolysin family protein [Brevibacterium sp. ZH18]|uniref:hemolysin family protein n=1 Tax=Brevibacterium sp. ZH18 TaxID=2927784 RepID=UPI001F60BC9D|nr:hemolysin family protein [Brevibacterium sp. ZH18]MCI4009873.1 hemolysin family protein [Brevibacterium sp. ZH18]